VVPTNLPWMAGEFDGIWLGAALPSVPEVLTRHLADGRGRMVTLVGPRYRAQDLVCLRRDGRQLREQRLGRARVPVARGLGCWVRGV
jgi:protein-L-isoaspartate O-methyltransferase